MKLYGTTSFFVLTKKSVCRRDLFSIGLSKIGDLLSCNNTTTFRFMNLLLNPEQSFFVMSIIDSIPTHWCTIIKDSSSLPIIFPVLDAPSIIIDGNPLTFFDVSSKQIYQVPSLCHRLGEGLFSIFQIVYGIKTERI